MSSIGVITALQSEAICLGNLLRNKNFVHRVSGIGPNAAKDAAKELCINGCSALISFGYAGALNSNFQSGALIIGNSVSNGQKTINIQSAWLNKFNIIVDKEITVPIYRAAFLSTPSPLLTKIQKTDHNPDENWSAVDMESYAVAEEATKYGIPVLIIRAILDELDAIIPATTTNIIDTKGRLKLFAAIYMVLKNPKDLKNYLALAAAKSSADRTLRRVAAIIARSGLV